MATPTHNPSGSPGKDVPSPRRLIVLGSTGSIGCNTLDVAEHLAVSAGLDLQVVGLAAMRSTDKLIEQARRFNTQYLAVTDADAAKHVQAALPGVTLYTGDGAAEQLVRAVECTDVAAAIVGSAGLGATLAAAELGRTIHLSNKETLVAAGALVMPLIERTGARLMPVDSEHSAIFQCLHGRDASAVQRLVLTASGGPFRNTDLDSLRHATPEQALAHPTWDMGPKVTIDSATMMNKALEIIEAHYLFNLPAEQIDAIIHPQSMVHSFVEMRDGSVLAQLGPPDMRSPIQTALTWPNRAPSISTPMDWASLSQLDFEPVDEARFPALQLAYRAIRAGGTAGAVMNAANEAAVQAFLDHQIPFGQIVELVASAMDTIAPGPADSLERVFEADHQARRFVHGTLSHDPAITD
ncbi:MAG: 1-deoxy-D-xylulose-5-phosphate reductoisomerase [Phycisphaerales bacterium JB063]